jgi:hypothetical protein
MIPATLTLNGSHTRNAKQANKVRQIPRIPERKTNK